MSALVSDQGDGTMITKDELERVIQRELAWIENAERRVALEAILVEPRVEEREWDYGEPGEIYSYWVVGSGARTRKDPRLV